jgi:outer membrane protein
MRRRLTSGGSVGRGRRVLSIACVALLFGNVPLSAESLHSALSRAYTHNPTLNSERASLRALDEQVPQALSGYRPQVFSGVNVSSVHQNFRPGQSSSSTSTSLGVTVEQPLYRGNRTRNETQQAESTVLAGREALRNVEQNILFSAVEAYMDVVRDEALLQLRQRNIAVLEEELRATRDRFEVGEVTRTDVAQAEARLSGAVFDVNTAQANLMASRARYREVIGIDPSGLQAPSPAADLPPTLEHGVQLGRQEHPAILSSIYAEEASAFAVNVAEGVLLPTLSLQASADTTFSSAPDFDRRDQLAVTLQLSIPIYQGGIEYSRVREAKQVRSQRMLEVDVARQQVHAAVTSAWGGLEAATAAITSARAQVEAAEIALEGVRQEAEVGQRTTLDVLNAEAELLNARVSLVVAERDQVVASYALLSAVGRLDSSHLGLAVAEYQPEQNYHQVRDKWFGLRTPSGQ